MVAYLPWLNRPTRENFDCSKHARKQRGLSLTMPEDLLQALDLVRGLIEARAFKKERLDDPQILGALSTIGHHAANGKDPSHRFTSLAALGKAREISKPIALAVHGSIERALESELPPMAEWGAAEDRYYLAKAVAVSGASWISGYAAAALAQAEISEKLSRDQWAEIAISRSETLANTLQIIAKDLSNWLKGRHEVTDLAYRKLAKVCEALAQTLLIADVPTGSEFGKAFNSLVSVAGGGKGAETFRVREEAAIGILDLVIQTLRLRFDVLFDSDIYRAVGAVRRWWRPARPPDDVERRVDRIANLAMQGLHILARQGVSDNELRRALATALDASRVNSAGQTIASSDPSLGPKSSRWLATGQELSAVRSNETMQEINEQATDELLGKLLLMVSNEDVSSDTLASIAEAIELFEPAHAAALRKSKGRLDIIRQWVDALANKRRLATYASRGELVRYDPAINDSDEELQRLSEVRVAVPGVVRVADGRPPLIIIKAVVQKL